MIVVIQDAAGRQPHAGHLKTRDGRRVLFVADPGQAPGEAGVCHALPDAPSGFCVSWRKLLLGYNANPRNNPLGLLPAYLLYPDEIYARLVGQLGPNRTFILSAGWGLVKAPFLTPNYDITFNPAAEAFRRRQATDEYADFCMLPEGSDEDLYFFGDEAYLPLFCKLTAAHRGRRIVFYHSATPPAAPGCELRVFETAHSTNWHHECAAAFLSARPEPHSEQSAPRVSHIESRLRAAMTKLPGASPSLPFGGLPLDDRAVRSAIRDARGQIAEYRWLVRSLRDADVTDNPEFQERFNAFHRIAQRSTEWQAAYFELLEMSKLTGADFADVLHTLWEEAGRYEPAFASRLVATVDPGQPVWDRFALMNTGLRAPAYPDPDKLEKAVKLYQQIGERYAAHLASPAGQRILELFDEEAPDLADIGALKKLEFVLRHARAQNTHLTMAEQTAASRSHPA